MASSVESVRRAAARVIARIDRSPRGLPLVVAVALATAVFAFVARHRLIDADEGYYLLAARLVAEGAVVYRDFFYPQTPWLPSLYGAWLEPSAIGWLSGRAVSVACGALIALLVYREVARSTASRGAGLAAVTVLAASGLALGWFTVVKTYAAATLLVLGATFLLARDARDARDTRHDGVTAAFAAGLLVGLATGIRLMSIAAVGAFAIHLLRHPPSLRRLVALGAGLLGGLLPMVPVVLAGGIDRAWFANLGYHAIRSGEGLVGSWRQKLRVLFDLFGGDVYKGDVGGLQFALLLACAVAAFRLRDRLAASSTVQLYLLVAVFQGAIRVLPTPTFVQYFSVTVPCLAVVAGILLADRLAADARPERAAWVPLALVALIALAPLEIWRYARGHGVPGVDEATRGDDWRVGTARRVARTVDGVACPGEPVLASWPGDLVESRAAAVAGAENHFGRPVANDLDPATAARHHLLSDEDWRELIDRGAVRVVALRPGFSGFDTSLAARLADAGYGTRERVGPAVVAVLDGAPRPCEPVAAGAGTTVGDLAGDRERNLY